MESMADATVGSRARQRASDGEKRVGPRCLYTVAFDRPSKPLPHGQLRAPRVRSDLL